MHIHHCRLCRGCDEADARSHSRRDRRLANDSVGSGLADTPYWTSTEALFAEELPARLAVIGSSFVALETAQAYRRLGVEVTVLARSIVLTRDDPEFGAALQQAFEAEGIRVLNRTEAERVTY